MKNVVVFKGSTGLNNLIDPVRIAYDEQSGISDLAEAYNVDIDDSGRISRRKGYVVTARTESIHSLWAEREYCLYVSGNSLYRLNPDYSYTGLRTGVSIGAIMDYAYVNRKVYYCNGFENGYVDDNVSYPWVKPSSYVGQPDYRDFSDMPVGHLVCYYNGRMFVARDDVVYYSEPFNYGACDLARNYFLFSSRIKALRAVSDGLFVSDGYGIYSLQFTQPYDAKQTLVYDCPIIEGSAINGDVTTLQLPATVLPDWSIVQGKVMLCATNNGICVGLNNGVFRNLTQDRIVFPTANKATAALKDNTYIVLLQE